MGAQSNDHLHNVSSHKMLKDRTALTDVEQLSQIPYLLYNNLYSGHSFPQFGTCGGSPPLEQSSLRDCSRDPHLPYIHI